MFTQMRVTDAELHHVLTKEIAQSKRISLLASTIGIFLLIFTVLILGMMAIARMGTLPQIPELPKAYLPGSPFPSELSCREDSYEVYCSGRYLKHDVLVTYDADTGLITSTVTPVREYCIGQLIIAWGTPTGATWNASGIWVYWGIRAAFIDARSLEPDTKVEFVLYLPREQQVPSWQGFRRQPLNN